MRIARVFPRRTNITPIDDDVYIGQPTMFAKGYDQVHISCTFTWDIPKVQKLQQEWQQYFDDVRIGGPAFNDPGANFTGFYTRPGVTITSLGMPESMSVLFCAEARREDKGTTDRCRKHSAGQ
jgi:hypothetical protein